jgi:hypothetical protein
MNLEAEVIVLKARLARVEGLLDSARRTAIAQIGRFDPARAEALGRLGVDLDAFDRCFILSISSVSGAPVVRCLQCGACSPVADLPAGLVHLTVCALAA